MSSASQKIQASWYTQMAGWVHRRSTLWVLLSLLAFAILIGHQSLGVIDRDEARFAQASKQMLASGDYITPRFMDGAGKKAYWDILASVYFCHYVRACRYCQLPPAQPGGISA